MDRHGSSRPSACRVDDRLGSIVPQTVCHRRLGPRLLLITVADARLVILRKPVIASLPTRLALALLAAPPSADGGTGPASTQTADAQVATTSSRGHSAGPAEVDEVAPRSGADAPVTAEPSADADNPPQVEDEDEAILARPPQRRFMLGLEGLVVQAPPLRPDAVSLDPRFLGRSVSLAGLGIFGRVRLHHRVAVETTVRSGSVRYAGRQSDADDDVVSHDQVMADVGVLLFVARGEIAQLAFDGGLGAMGSRVKYELDREGTQLFASGLVRVGADAEFLVKRIAFVVSVRAYGAFTNRDRVRNQGPLLEGRTLRSPVPALQTMLVGSAGVAYRF